MMSVARKQLEPQPGARKVAAETSVLQESPIQQLQRQLLQSRVFWCLLGAAAVLLCVILWSQLPWLAAERASWNDERLFVNPVVVSLDGIRARQNQAAEFFVKNLTNKTINLRWMNANSSFFAVQLPVDIEPGEKKLIELTVLLPHEGRHSHHAVFITSDEIKPAFFVRFAGEAVP